MPDKKERRPIDIRRDSAGSFEVGAADDPIRLAFEISGSLHIVKDRSIYLIKLADEIDPGRVNERIPNVQQQVLDHGASSPIVARTLLTAKQLLNASYLSSTVDTKRGITLAFEYLKDIAAMDSIHQELEAAEARENATFNERQARGSSLLLPSIRDIEARCESFIQKADHALVSLLDLTKLFYGKDAGKQWFEGLAEHVERREGVNPEFAKYVRSVLPICRLVRNIRNSIEHAKENERIVVKDCAMLPNGEISSPSFELTHPTTPHPPVDVAALFKVMTEGLVDIFEGILAHLCANNMRPERFGPFPIGVIMLPEGQRAPYNNIRVCWGFRQGDHVVVAS